MVVVVRNIDALIGEVVNRPHRGIESQCWQLQRNTAYLLTGLIEVVEVEVTIPPCPDEFARLKVAHLGHHAGQQTVRGYVERHAEEGVSTPLVELARELAVVDVELEKGMAGHQRHLIQFADVPSRDDDAPAVRSVANQTDGVLDLVNHPAVVGLPLAPLFAVHRPEVSFLVSPFVPDSDLVILEIADIGVP